MQRLFKHYCAVCWFSPDDGAAAISLSVGLRLFTCSTSPPLLLVWVGSRLLTCRLIAVPYFHPSTSEITPGFGSLKFCSGLGRVWGFYRDPQLGDHCGKLLVLNLCVFPLYWGYGVDYDVVAAPLLKLRREILFMILMGQVPFWNCVNCSVILISSTVIVPKYRTVVLSISFSVFVKLFYSISYTCGSVFLPYGTL